MSQIVLAAGLLHFCQVPAMVAAPRMLGWQQDLERLQPINRRIVKVIGLAIVIVVLGLGMVVASAPGELLNGGRLALGLTSFLAVFWLYRAVVQVTLYARIWPGGFLGRASFYGLSVLFFALAGMYLAAFVFNIHR
jgi:hypothetical protein